MRWKPSILVTALAFGITCGPALADCENAKLLAEDGAPDDRFGSAVSIDGDVIVVGALEADTEGGINAGAAYVYRLDGSTWEFEAKLTASDGFEGDLFGATVAVSGDVIIVGAWQVTVVEQHQGAAYVFRRIGSAWVEEAKLVASDPGHWFHFGESIALDGDVALVGAPDWSASRGSAYVFRFNGEAWIEEARLISSDNSTGDWFAKSIDLEGDLLVVGATGDDDQGNFSGSVYVFRFDGDDWVQEQKLIAPDGMESDHFGSAVAVSGEAVLVGARADDDLGDGSGSAYVFRHQVGLGEGRGGEWTFEQKLLAADGFANDRYGLSAALSGDTALVGAYLHDPGTTCCDLGAVYVYRYDGSTWTQEQELGSSDQALAAQFGYAVAIDGERVVAGARWDDDLGVEAGAAYAIDDLSTLVCGHDPLKFLWNNDDGQRIAGHSNTTKGIFEFPRTLLDDFEIPKDETWRITGFRHFHIWNTLPAGSGEGMEIAIWSDGGDEPGEFMFDLTVTGYEEEGTGREFFNRPEAVSWTRLEPVDLDPGHYWFEATIVGTENNFWLTIDSIFWNEHWVNYEEFGGLMSGTAIFGGASDLAWAIDGQLVTCPGDFDGDGVVGASDLLALLVAWGPCFNKSGCPEDLDDDGTVGAADLLALLVNWGPCP